MYVSIKLSEVIQIFYTVASPGSKCKLTCFVQFRLRFILNFEHYFGDKNTPTVVHLMRSNDKQQFKHYKLPPSANLEIDSHAELKFYQ